MDEGRKRIYKRTYTSLKIHALRHHGSMSERDLVNANLPTRPEVLKDVLLDLQTKGLLKIVQFHTGEMVYDFLPFLERSAEESVLDLAFRMELARIYLRRKMWTAAIAELRITRTNPKFKKESLYLLGTCFEEKKAYVKAQENYEYVLAMDYYYRDTLERLSKIKQKERQDTGSGSATLMFMTAQNELSNLLQDRYEIVRELGRGGAGAVYQAVDLKLKRDVAVKVLYRQAGQSHSGIADILREAQVAARLKHPNIVDIYDVDTDAQFIAMEFIDGGTLRDALDNSSLALEQARSVISQLCAGLQFAHNQRVLHRDIKPANIFITQKKRIKLGDFGIAHQSKVEQTAFTQLSAQIGTLPYMSPEQVRGEGLSAASDIYAVGVVLYEMLTGSPPFIRGDIAYHHLHSQPKTPNISADLDEIVLRCLEKDPQARFQSAEALQQRIRRQADEEKRRVNTYRELLKMAIVDKELSKAELLVLKMKRKSLKLSDEEVRQVEQEFGLTLPG
ncbi:MAG: serine/threonine protein kinase [bacterium]|nr:serine/threonine protein kinase [bacterium]